MSTTNQTLEELQTLYNNQLILYDQKLLDYKNSLTNYPNLVSKQGVDYNATNLGQVINSSTLQSCTTACKANRQCTGATFVSNTRTCQLKSGNGTLVPSNNNTYTIYSKTKLLLLDIVLINDKLIDLNKQIKLAIKNQNVGGLVSNNNKKENELEKIYDNLLKEKKKINYILDSLELINDDSSIIVTQNYYLYVLLSILVIICIFLLIIPYNFNPSGIIQNIDLFANENSSSILIIIISVPFAYFLVKYFLNMVGSKFANRYINI